ARNALQKPDMSDRRCQVDMTHAVTAHLGVGDLDAAALAGDAPVTDTFVLAAIAFPVFGGSKDPLAEETIFLGLEGPVVDGLGLGDLAMRPAENPLRR